jgi:hypothetical protein
MEVDEITVPSAYVPGGLSFGPVTLESAWEGALDSRDELPVTLTPRCSLFLGIRWYPERYHTRGVFNVTRDHIAFRPTAHVSIERAGWWRRVGFRLLTWRAANGALSSAHNARSMT